MKDKDLKNIIQKHKSESAVPKSKVNLQKKIFHAIEREDQSSPRLVRGMIFVSVFMFFIFSIGHFRHNQSPLINQTAQGEFYQDLDFDEIDIQFEDFFENNDDQFEVAVAIDFIALLDEV
jgi:hypothetical protein